MGRKRGVQFRMGSFWRQDDRSGFARRAEDTKIEWNNQIVGTNLWEARQPQDFVTGVADIQSVPDARPVSPTVFDGPIYIPLSQAAAIGDTFINLQSIAGVSFGDKVGVMMDNGAIFNTTAAANPTSAGVAISSPMPFTAASGNDFIDYGAQGP